MKKDSETTVIWLNHTKGKVCVVVFSPVGKEKDDTAWSVMRRDSMWELPDVYGIPESKETILDVESARKLWQVLCKKHGFYNADKK
jgi:hypothetical protein